MNKNMKRMFFSFGLMASAIATASIAVSCSSSSSQPKNITTNVGIENDKLIIKINGKDLPSDINKYKASIKSDDKIKIELESISKNSTSGIVTLEALDEKNQTWTINDLIGKTVVIEVDGFNSTEALIQNNTPVDPSLPSEPESGSLKRSQEKTIVSSNKPTDVYSELSNVKSFQDLYQLFNFSMNSKNQEVDQELSKIKSLVATKDIEIDFSKFSYCSSEIDKIIFNDQALLNEIKTNMFSSQLSSGYDVVLKKRYLIGQHSNNEPMPPMPADGTQVQNKNYLQILVQLTKDGQEIIGASQYISLENVTFKNIVDNPFVEPPKNATEWKEKIYNMLTLMEKEIDLLPNQFNEDHFSAYDNMMRKLLGVNNDEFQITSFVSPTQYSYQVKSYSIANIVVDKNTNQVKFVARELGDNSYFPDIQKFATKEQFKKLISLSREFATKGIDVAFDLSKPEWWYINFNKLAQTKNKEIFKLFDQIINTFIEAPTHESQPIYQLKQDEIQTIEATPKEGIFKKMDIEKLINSPIIEIEQTIKSIFSKENPFNETNLSYYPIKIDLDNNEMEMVAFYGNYPNTTVRFSPINKLDNLNILSNKEYKHEYLTLNDFLDVNKYIINLNESTLESLSWYDNEPISKVVLPKIVKFKLV